MNRTSKNEIHLLARIKIKFMWALVQVRLTSLTITSRDVMVQKKKYH